MWALPRGLGQPRNDTAMPTLPPPPAIRLTPAQAAAVAKRGRKLLRAGRITHRTHAILDTLLWSCRRPDTGAIVVSYTGLCKLVNVSRKVAVAAVAALERLGVLSRIKRRVRVAWHQGGQQSRQATNAYVLHPGADHTEFPTGTVNQQTIEILHIQQPSGAVREAQEALARRAREMQQRLLGKNVARPA